MKKLTMIIAVLTLFFACTKNSKFTNLSGFISLNANVPVDSIYVGIYKARRVGTSPYTSLDKPIRYSASIKETFSFNILPGTYTLAAWAFGYEPLREQIYIPKSGENIKVEIKLDLKSLPEKIEKVQLTGDFCNFYVPDSPDMIKKGNQWIPNDPDLVQRGTKYKFIIDGMYRYDLRQKKVAVARDWSTFDNVHTGEQPIIFDPSLYKRPMTKSVAEFENSPLNNQYNEMLIDLAAWEEAMYKARRDSYEASYEKSQDIYQSLVASLDSMDQKYDPSLHQRILDVKIARLFYLHPIWNKIRANYNEGAPDTAAIKAIFLSDEFVSLCMSTLEMIKKIDPTSYLIEGEFISGINALEIYTEEYPELAAKCQIANDYFYDYILNFVKKCPNKDVCAQVLYQTASHYSRDIDKSEKVKFLINLLKGKYADDFYVGEGHADKILTQLKIIIGAEAPQFAVQTLAGDSLRLSDYKGQYVYLDFWGTWCGPCRGETPNLKALSNSIPKDKLIVIGLANDDEKPLREYIEKENIDYPNALAGEKVLDAFGINAFPTMILIGPDGKIVAKDLRGKRMTELVKEEMDEYDKNLRNSKIID